MDSDLLYAARDLLDRAYLLIRDADEHPTRAFERAFTQGARRPVDVARAAEVARALLSATALVARGRDAFAGAMWIGLDETDRPAILRAFVAASGAAAGLASLAAGDAAVAARR